MERSFHKIPSCSYYYSQGAYITVKNLRTKRGTAFILLLLLGLSTLGTPAFSVPLTVETDKEAYFTGEHVTISGSADPGESINVVVKISDTTIFDTTIVVPQEGTYNVTFLLVGAQPGDYVVYATSASDEAEVEFRIVDGDCKLAHDLLELLHMSREKTGDIISEIMEDYPEYSDALYEKFMKAEEAAEEAYELYEEGKCQEAAAKATEALRLYGESMKLAERLIEEEPDEDDFEEEVEKVLELKDAIERLRAYLIRVNETSRELEDKGFDVSAVDSLIEEAFKQLLLAEELLDERSVEEAYDLISEIERIIKHAMELLHNVNEVNRIEKARRFLTETEDRLELMEERVTNILGNLGVSGQVLEALSDVFEEARMGIEEVKALLETGDLESAIDEFEEIFDETEDGLELVEEFDEHRVEILEEIERLEAEIRYLAEKVEALRAEGFDVSELILHVKEAYGLLEIAVDNLESGDVKAANILIEEAEDIVEWLEDEVERLLIKLGVDYEESDDTEEGELGPDSTEDVFETDDVEVLELLGHIGELEEIIARLAERLEAIREEGCDIMELVPHFEVAKRLVQAAVDNLREGDKESTRILISELEERLDFIENKMNALQEEGPCEEEAGTCTEDEIFEFGIKLNELEEEIACLEEAIEALGDSAEKLASYIEIAKNLYSQITELKPCEEATIKKMSELWDLLEFIETEVRIILEEKPEKILWYYVLEVDGEACGKFEFMVVKIYEDEARIVFEEGLVYDHFVEWILSAEEAITPKSGRIISVYNDETESVEWYFEGAIPISWTGTNLDSITGESHPIERLELTAEHVEEAI